MWDSRLVQRSSSSWFCASALLFCLTSITMAQQQLNTAKVLIFSKTDGFRHESIPAATEALQAAGPTKQIEFDATEDATRFSDDGLAGYDAVLFLMNTAEVLAEDQTKALQNYLNAGGNFIAIHSASDAVRATPFYGQALGAYFDHHANLQNATVLVADKNHPSTSSLPDRWPVYDEIYYFKSDPRSIGAKVILSVDESSYHDQDTTYVDVQGKPHPLAWYQERVSGTDASATRVGRSWYTSLGHEISVWSDSIFMAHVMGGITWTLASGTTKAFDASSSVGNSVSAGGASASTTASAPRTSSTNPTGSARRTGVVHSLIACLSLLLTLSGS
ncbi:class I glutamine amidotransferase-like protein [Auriculariales sp. MPI-PUGE-AT-0066]|nr:class I glutamine amidotransferase-like protein [Auriculariales sp. MPI-PUGE-AT-0066]